MTDSGPNSSTVARSRVAISPIAASQLIRSNCPLPLGPVRRIGNSTRPGSYTRSR
ncbi:hypothetical protein [Klenkia terrae]|uniref:Uncharacterized protein n=1 Tax=Klenkia terrae TaxID=1052259 RepID=A0ABU8E1A3_9ACTN